MRPWGRYPSGQRGQSVKLLRKLRWFESNPAHFARLYGGRSHVDPELSRDRTTESAISGRYCAGMTRRWGWVRSRVAALVVGAAVVLTACAGTGYHYVKSSSDKTYFKVPDSWKLYDENSVLDALKGALSKDELNERRDTTWTTVFDANPSPSINHLASKAPSYPLGRAVVQPLSVDSADTASLQSLRNIFFDVDDALQKGTAHVTTYEPVELDGGFHGSHLV